MKFLCVAWILFSWTPALYIEDRLNDYCWEIKKTGEAKLFKALWLVSMAVAVVLFIYLKEAGGE